MGSTKPRTSSRRRVVVGLNYYTPYVSGLTNAARDICEGLVTRGWDVSVVTTQHSPDLPLQETLEGVSVTRVPKRAQVSKAAIAPRLPSECARQMRGADVAMLHLPMPEAGLIATLLGRRTPLVTVYQCDVHLPGSAVNRLVERAMDTSTRVCARRSARIVVSSMDYLGTSRVRSSLWDKSTEIAPPTLQRPVGPPSYRDGDGPHIGFLGRIVEEKGIPYLVEAFQQVAQPDWRLLIGGDHQAVAGGSVVRDFSHALGADSRIRLLGFIPDERMGDFYASLDVFAFPSVNPLEAFGIAQVEAMLSGVPVVASSLPGVRKPIERSGFGVLVPPRDPQALAGALQEVLTLPEGHWTGYQQRAVDLFGLEQNLDTWEALLIEVADKR